MLAAHEKKVRQRLKDDLPHYAEKCLKIRTKSGAVVPLLFNRAQRFIHERLESQRRKTGRVRAIILKGRQQGCSTYVSARIYHRVTHSRGVRAFILTHEDPATQNLFEMATRFHENCNPLVKPSTGAANAKELSFDGLDSGYRVGTAGTKGVGRSSTIQLFHGSEVAFWPHADTHASGILQALPNEDGTEGILESTANGLGNFFHQTWQEAQAGLSDFTAIFIPWFWQDEYRREAGHFFVATEEEKGIADAHGLDNDQLAWRRNKIVELKSELLFKQEYPSTPDEAFQTTGHDSFIRPESVLKARKASHEGIGALVIGADPSRFGNDRFSMAWRKGRKVEKIESRQKIDAVEAANWIGQIIRRDKPARVFMDAGGGGAQIYDILKSWGEPYASIVKPVDFGGAPQEPEIILSTGEKRPGPKNRRAEMWSRSRDWLEDIAGADIPDSDTLQADACAPGYHYDMGQRLLLESKEHIRARNVSSPDEWDAVALTFAEPVALPRRVEPIERPPAHIFEPINDGWMT